MYTLNWLVLGPKLNMTKQIPVSSQLFGHRGIADNDGGNVFGDSAGVHPSDEAVVTLLPPSVLPRVLDDPVLDPVFLAVSDDQDGVIDLERGAVLFDGA